MAKTFYMRNPDGSVFTTQYPEYHRDAEQLSQAKGKEARREYCIAELRKLVQPGTKVYTLVRKVASSGMSRTIALYIVDKGEIRNISTLAADVLQWPEVDGGIKVAGCGMDMTFHTVYTLGRYLFREGFGVEGVDPFGKPCRPSSLEDAAELVRAGAVFRGRNGDASGWDGDGGYALQRESM